MNYRTRLIKLVTFLGGIYFFLEFILPGTVAGVKVDQYHEKISNGFTAIGAAAIGLGLINLLMVHGAKITLLRKGWLESAVLLAGLVSMVLVTTIDWHSNLKLAERTSSILNLKDFAKTIQQDFENQVAGVPELGVRNSKLKEALEQELAKSKADFNLTLNLNSQHPDLKLFELAKIDNQQNITKVASTIQQISDTDKFTAHAILQVQLAEFASTTRELLNLHYKHSIKKNLYELMYQGFFVALGAAMFSLLGFYIAVAAYRAFRVRSPESALMMSAALVVMLGQIPFGIWIWDSLPDLRMWLLSVPNSAAFRAIKIGAAVAGLIMAFRMWLSIESESFAEPKK